MRMYLFWYVIRVRWISQLTVRISQIKQYSMYCMYCIHVHFEWTKLCYFIYSICLVTLIYLPILILFSLRLIEDDKIEAVTCAFGAAEEERYSTAFSILKNNTYRQQLHQLKLHPHTCILYTLLYFFLISFSLF